MIRYNPQLANYESDSKALWRTVKSLVRAHEHIDDWDLQVFKPVRVWLKDVELSILLIKQIFINKDNSTGIRYLATNNLDLTSEDFLNIYKKRWSIEEYHKNFKQNTSITKSPTKTVKTQCTHIFAAIVSYTKLERDKFSTKLNHFALKSKLFLNAAKAAFRELELIKQQHAEFESLGMTA